MNPVVALILANIIWGFAVPIYKIALGNIPVFAFTFIRFFVAAIIFLPLALHHWQRITIREFFLLTIGAIFGLTLHIPLLYLGIQKTLSINVPIIGSAAPVFIYFLSITFLKEKPQKKVLKGMLISLLGVLVIILSPLILEGKGLAFGEVEGNFLLLASALAGIFHPIIYKKILGRLNPYIVTFWYFLLGSIPILPFFIGELNFWSPAQLNQAGVFGLVYATLFSSVLTYGLFTYGLSKIKAEEIGIFQYIDPVATIILAVPLLGERPNFYFFIGSILVFGGIFLAEKRFHWHPFHRISAGYLKK